MKQNELSVPPATPVKWLAWRVATPNETIEVTAKTAYLAKQQAMVELQCEPFELDIKMAPECK